MKYEVIDNKFIAIKGINHIKKTNIEVGEYEVKNNTINGYLLIDVTYMDNEEMENIFHSKLPIQIFVDEEKCELEISDSSINVIDNQGIEVLFSLVIKSNEEKIKEEIEEELDIKLVEALKERDDSFLDDRENIEDVIIEEKINIEENISIEEDITLEEDTVVIMEEKEEMIMPKYKDKFQTYKILYNKFQDVCQKFDIDKIIKDDNDFVIVETNERD